EGSTAFYGDITGLVGIEGVVASFASTASTGTFGPYVGGFVAVPTDKITRSPPVPNFETWSQLALDSIEATPAVYTTDPITKVTSLTTKATYTHFPLTILDGISSKDANLVNFVEGKATALSRNIKEGGTIATIAGYSQFSAHPFTVLGDFADTGASGRDSSIPITLTLGDTYSQGDKDFNLDGDVADGISFLIGDVDTTTTINNKIYVGLLSGTDLGAPIDKNVSATWQGRLYYLQTQSFGSIGDINTVLRKTVDVNRGVDFRVEVNFDEKTIKADVRHTTATANRPINAPYYSFDIDGKFDAETGIVRGVVEVQVHDSLKPSYTLSGLIGEEGLVAVFGSDLPTETHTVFGGFVARPTADVIATTGTLTTADWIRGFNYDDRPRVGAFENPAHFLRGDKYGLSTADFDSVPFGAEQRFLRLDNDDKDGVSFLAGRKGNTTRYYSGLLSSTNVGPTLDNANQGGTWAGTIGVISGSTYDKSGFSLNVDFAAKTISASGIRLGTKTNVAITGSWEQTTRVATIAARPTTVIANPPGRIHGTITGLDDAVDGILTGIIGQDGAVGAFISGVGSTAIYAGGFVANPSEETEI
ncbi:MAG: hypothetical protein K8953_00930, partial [Proteobacteria bacterium]|nr:hypothetical protein [Pseudomonadota bacterium]